MLTTPALTQFLQLREGFRKHAYDDAKPNVELTEDTEIEGTLTIGYGTTFYPDGRKVSWDDKVTKSEATDYLENYIKTIVEPALENIIHVPLTGFQYDALGSLIYQYGEGEVSSWRLPKRINAGEDWEKIVLEWINGTVMWKGSPLFWGRRVMEVFMFLGLNWSAGSNVPSDMNIIDAVQDMGFDGNLPKPGPAHTPTETEYAYDEDLFNELEIKKSGEVITDPTPEDGWTTSDLNIASAESLRTGKPIDYGVPMTKLTKKTPVESVHYLADEDKKPGNVTVKPIEESRRGRGYAKSEMGKQGMIAGAGGSAAVAIGAAEPVVRFVDKYPSNTIAIVFAGLLLFGLGLHFYGKWERARGEDGAEDLLG